MSRKSERCTRSNRHTAPAVEYDFEKELKTPRTKYMWLAIDVIESSIQLRNRVDHQHMVIESTIELPSLSC